jgi:hypothetical protein
MGTRRSAIAVVGTLTFILTATATSTRQLLAESALRNGPPRTVHSLDIHTPLPIAPCNGAAFTVGQNITLQWHEVAFAWMYGLKFKDQEPDQTLLTHRDYVAVAPTMGWWTVNAQGSWGISTDSQHCDYVILPAI